MAKNSRADMLLDFSGAKTGIAFDKGFVFSLCSSLLIYFACALINPLAAYGPLISKALGFFAAAILFMVTSRVNLAVIAMLVATLGVMIGFFDWGTVSSKLGSSQFYNMLGMIIVASGCEFTFFGKRFSYIILKRFGQKPVRMIIVIGVSAAALSAFVSNVATIILFSSIMNSMLLSMNEKPGESRIGRVVMLIIPMCASVGGMALFCGSPIGNAAALSYMSSAIGQDSYAASFAQWAAISVPTFLIVAIPSVYIYIRWFKVKNSDSACPSPSYYDDLIAELGPIGGSEIRWIIFVAGMVTAMLLGMKTAYAAMLFAALSLFPVIGVAPAGDVIKKVPWTALLAICMLPLLGTMITETGLSDWISRLVAPLLGEMSPLMFTMITAILMAVCINLLVNAMQGTMALIMSIAAPLCISLGYNPTIVLLPAAFAASFYWCMGANQYVAINKDYGWWEMKDPIVPGLIVAVFLAVVSSIVACTIGPLVGMPLYL